MEMKKQFSIIKTIIATSALLLLPTFAQAEHFNPYGYSVDGGEIRWDGTTKYGYARDWGIQQWNALGKVSILPDTATTYADVTFEDVYVPKVGWEARWVDSLGADEIQFNTYYMDYNTSFANRAVATHELGHALGLGDHGENDNWTYRQIIMWYCAECSGVNTPQSHDKYDYEQLW